MVIFYHHLLCKSPKGQNLVWDTKFFLTCTIENQKMANQNKKPLRFTKRTKRRKKKDIYKHLTVQAKRGKNQIKPFLSHASCSGLLGAHPVFSPFCPCRKAFHHTCPLCQFFYYFFPFFPSEAFFYSISHCVTNSSAPWSNIFCRSGGNFVILTSFWRLEVANGVLLNS